MDMETMRRLEREADERDQTAAVLEHWKRKADRRRFLAFCFNWRQVVDAPDVPVPSPGAHALPHTSAASGLGTRAAGFRDVTPTNALNPLTSGSRLPGGPTHLYCSEASRISAATNRHT